MRRQLAAILLIGALASVGQAIAAGSADDARVVLVTLDGVRWQDVFRGADPKLAAEPQYVSWRAEIARKFVAGMPCASTHSLFTMRCRRCDGPRVLYIGLGAAIGPAVAAPATADCVRADQIAATMLVALGEDRQAFSSAAKARTGAPLFVASPSSAR